MARAEGSQRRQRGSFELLPNGACRVRVYAGKDPVTKREHYLRETVPAGRSERETLREAEKVRARLVNELYERRNPRTNATVSQLLERHLREARLAEKTRRTYQDLVDKHVLPFLGQEKVGSVDADVLDPIAVCRAGRATLLPAEQTPLEPLPALRRPGQRRPRESHTTSVGSR